MTSSPGRPLRFLVWLVGGWIGLRAMVHLGPALWAITGPAVPSVAAASRTPTPSEMRVGGRTRWADGDTARQGGGEAVGHMFVRNAALSRARRLPGAVPARNPVQQAGAVSPTAFAGATGGRGVIDRISRPVHGSEGRSPAIGVSVTPQVGASGRWSGTAWMLWRRDVASGLASAPLLGGSQAGARFDYRLTGSGAGQVSLYGRISRAFDGPSSEEGAAGLAWRPTRLPVSLLAERRQRLGPGGRNGFALLAAGGFGPRELAPQVEAEGYAQAGIVGLPGADGFADGKASLGYRLTAPSERPGVTLGASLSGSIQPGAERVDMGPEVRVRLPLGAVTMRLSAEWRTRVAGSARPAHGPAITLVADF